MRSKKTFVTIPFNPVLGTFIQRLNRFMVLVEVDHEKALAHLSNSGRLSTVLLPGATVHLRERSVHSTRRSRFDLFAVSRSGMTVIVDAQFSNSLAKIAFERNLFEGLGGYHVKEENVRIDDARLDLMLEKDPSKFFVEVKSVTHVINGVALFPDAPTVRGRRHVQDLMTLSGQGFETGMLFSVQKPDAKMLKPNSEIHPRFAELLREAVRKNVKIFTLRSVYLPPSKIELRPNDPVFEF